MDRRRTTRLHAGLLVAGGSLVIAVALVGCSGTDSGLGDDSSDPTSTGAPTGSDGGSRELVLESGANADTSAPNDSGTTTPHDSGTGVFDEAGGVSVNWGPGCWYKDSGHKYQAMSFQLTTDTKIPLEATLYYNTTCNPDDGTDNLNDTGGTIGSGGYTFWFIHHPDEIQTSAIWSFNDLTSGCIDYSALPDCN